MSHIHEDKKIAYLATPRTGTRSTTEALREIGFVPFASYHGGITGIHPNLRSVATTVRDPKDILASWVRRNIKPGMNPQEIVRAEIETNQWVANGRCASLHLPDTTQELRYENGLEAELNRWLNKHGLPSVTLPRIGESSGDIVESQWQIIRSYSRQERKELGYI